MFEENGGFENYLQAMSRSSTWGDGIVLESAVRLYGRPITLFLSKSSTKPMELFPPEMNNMADMIYLGYTETLPNTTRNHYVSLTKTSVSTAVDVDPLSPQTVQTAPDQQSKPQSYDHIASTSSKDPTDR